MTPVKKIKGRKRHIVTDTLGYLLMIHVHTANIQDRDGAVDLLKELGEKFPNLRHVFADGGYRGPKLKNAMGEEWTIQTITRSHDEKGVTTQVPCRRSTRPESPIEDIFYVYQQLTGLWCVPTTNAQAVRSRHSKFSFPWLVFKRNHATY